MVGSIKNLQYIWNIRIDSVFEGQFAEKKMLEKLKFQIYFVSWEEMRWSFYYELQ